MTTVTKSHRKRVATRVGRADTEGLFLLLWRTQLPWDSHMLPGNRGSCTILYQLVSPLVSQVSRNMFVIHSLISYSLREQGLSRRQKRRDTVIKEEAKPAAEREDCRAG